MEHDEILLTDWARGFVNAAWIVSRGMPDGYDIQAVLDKIDPSMQMSRSFDSFIKALSLVAIWTNSSDEPGDQYELAGAVQIESDMVLFLWQGTMVTWDMPGGVRTPDFILAKHVEHTKRAN
jgi:hypothetical protein